MASTPFKKAELQKVKVETYRTPHGDFISHHYTLYHPNLPRLAKVIATIPYYDKKIADINIIGNHEDYNKVGVVNIRNMKRQIMSDLNVDSVSGVRTGGARIKVGSGPKRVTVKETVEDDDIYHTKDLEEFSQHLIDKHGAHVEMYWTPEGHVNLQTLIVPKKLRNQGIASNVINDIKRYSNKNKVKIILNAVPLDNSTESEKLINFYKSHGFVENKGRHKDYRLAGIDTMYHNHKEKKKKL